ncbi:MAG: hypothetical protein JW730_18285 [Anaerolineales bacterium]|nr:hypothetical protein [Anaerolineales bacterium]
MINLAVSWNANPTAEQVTKYKVYLDGAAVGEPTGTSFTIPNVQPGNRSVAVSTVNSLTEGPQSDPIAVPIPALPSKVQNVKVSITFDLGA